MKLKFEEIQYNRRESARWALLSIGLMIVALYLAFLTFIFWFVNWWQFGIAGGLLILSLIGAVIAFRRI